MAALDEYQGIDAGYKVMLAAFFWDWYRANASKYTIPIKFWIFKKTLPLTAFYPLFELLFGPEPYSK